MSAEHTSRPTLEGLRVLEIGHFVAAPFGARLLADLGADVVKIEPLGGDPVRQWGDQAQERSLWWSVHGRNKRSLALDLKQPKARDAVLRLATKCDALMENFRPGHLERLGLSDRELREANPGLVIAHVSGFGQTGPYRDRAAFGVIGEALGGLRYLTNHPPGGSELPPVRVGVSIGDSIAGLYAAFGILAALWQRDRKNGDGVARTLDIALTESVLAMMEGMLPEFGKSGKIKQPTGGGIATAATSNAYPTSDGKYVLIAANSDFIFKRLASLMGYPELSDDVRFSGNAARVASAVKLDKIISDWSRSLRSEDLISRLEKADVPNAEIYTAVEIANDVQYRARRMVREIEDPLLGSVLHPGVVPHVPESPGAIRWTGPDIGVHTEEVLRELGGYDSSQIEALRREGAIA